MRKRKVAGPRVARPHRRPVTGLSSRPASTTIARRRALSHWPGHRHRHRPAPRHPPAPSSPGSLGLSGLWASGLLTTTSKQRGGTGIAWTWGLWPGSSAPATTSSPDITTGLGPGPGLGIWASGPGTGSLGPGPSGSGPGTWDLGHLDVWDLSGPGLWDWDTWPGASAGIGVLAAGRLHHRIIASHRVRSIVTASSPAGRFHRAGPAINRPAPAAVCRARRPSGIIMGLPSGTGLVNSNITGLSSLQAIAARLELQVGQV